MILVDTNVLVYAINMDAPQHSASRKFIESAQAKFIDGVVVPQVLVEFYAIVTDGRRVQKPLEPPLAWQQVEAFRHIFPVLDPGVKALDFLGQEIRGERKIKGADVFYAFLVAQMRAANISLVCTYDTRGFAGREGIVAQPPEAFLK